MSAIANLVIFDGAATPVSHTLVPISVTRKDDKVVAEYREMLTTIPVEAQVRATLTLQQLKSGIWKEEFRVVVPVMETVTNQNAAGYTASPKVAYEDSSIFTQFSHKRSTITGRRLCRQLCVNGANGITTTVTPTTTGPVPELVDQLVAPT
jgi:hypothetical protein